MIAASSMGQSSVSVTKLPNFLATLVGEHALLLVESASEHAVDAHVTLQLLRCAA